MFVTVTLISCAAGHNNFVEFRNDEIGTVLKREKPYKYKDSGEFIRGNYVVSGQGLTRISKNGNGDIVYYFSVQEILPNTRTEKEWIGKCLIYYIVEPDTFVVKEWGFDEGGNPLSCRTFT